MKIVKTFPLEKLKEYGFEKPDLKEFENDYIIQGSEYIYECGHARRGQWFYILINKEREINIYSTQPDGSGGKVPLPRVLIDLAIDEIIE